MAHREDEDDYDEDVSEDEDVAVSFAIPNRPFGIEPYLYDPSASSSSEGDRDTPDMPPPAQRVGTADWCRAIARHFAANAQKVL